MKNFIEGIKSRHRSFFSEPHHLPAVARAFFYLLISLVINYFACQYAFVSKGNSVTDILLDNLPVVHMDQAFVIGTIVFLLFLVGLLLYDPRKIAFVVKSIALFVVVRSFFVTLTHIGPSPLNTLSAPSDIGRAFTSGADLFFSGHTGMPFLFCLMYWYQKHLRVIFLVASILAGSAVLLGHIHYSIDVASAYFITYGIYIIARRIFPQDLKEFSRS